MFVRCRQYLSIYTMQLMSSVYMYLYVVYCVRYSSTRYNNLCRFIITGPTTHYFYEYLEKYVPRKQYLGFVKKVIVDRLLFAPTYLFVLLYFIAILEVTAYE